MLPAVAVFAEYSGTLLVGDTSEVRARLNNGPAAATTGPGVEATTRPQVTGTVGDREWRYLLSYGPSITYRQDDDQNPEVLHAGLASVSLQTRRVRLVLAETGTYGERNFTDPAATQPEIPGQTQPVLGTPPAPLQLVPTTRTIKTGSSTTALTTAVSLTRRWSIGSSVTYVLSGGLDAPSRGQLPVQHNARVAGTADFSATRTDRLLTVGGIQGVITPSVSCTIGASTAPTTCYRKYEAADIAENWIHQFTHHTDGTILAGVTMLQQTSTPDGVHSTVVEPFGSAGLGHNVKTGSGQFRLSVTGRVGPVVDQLTGTASMRLDSTAGLAWNYGRTTVTTIGQYTQDLPFDSKISAVTGTLTVIRNLGTRLDVSGGLRGVYQEQDGPFFVSTSAFVGFIYHEPVLKF